MATTEGIKLAKAKGLDLILVDYHVDPPVCQMKDSSALIAREPLDLGEGYSFDPALRVATIKFSSSIDDLEFERKVDILRKHLLEKRRCEVVVYSKSSSSTADEKTEILSRILREVQEIAKSPDPLSDIIDTGEVTIRVWPCNEDQVQPLERFALGIEPGESGDHAELERKGNPSKYRVIRPRPDPRLLPRDPMRGRTSDESD